MNTSHKLTHTLHSEAGAYPSGIHLNSSNPSPPLNSLATVNQRLLPRLCGLLRWAVVLGVLALLSANALAQGNFVYVNRNTVPNNVAVFAVGANGALIPAGVFPTGGNGDPGLGFFASNRETICVVGSRLYVANAGSNNVSVFDINQVTGALTAVTGSPFATGGVSGNSVSLACTPDGRFLMAANNTSNNITVFSIGANGALTPVAGSPFANPVGTGLNGVKITPDGRFLIVALVNTDQVAVFSIGASGALTPVAGSPFASPATGSAAGVEINCAGNLLFVGQAVFGATAVDVFTIGANGGLTPVPGSPFNFPGVGSNSNVVVLSPDNRFLFVSNQNSNTITVFNVAANGALTLVTGSPFANPGGSVPQQMATNDVGTLLYVNNDNGTVTTFAIGSNGALTPLGATAAGSAIRPGIAAFPPSLCIPARDPGALVSAQAPGSVLIYNIYTSSGSGQANQDTRINITNTSTTSGIYVHLFFVDGSTCAIADSYLCLTANQTSSFVASDIDPGVTGYIVAVAVNSVGCPVSFNYLIGDLYVKFATGHAANLGAEALPALWGFFNSSGQTIDRFGNLCQINGQQNPLANPADCGNNASGVQFFAGNLPVLPGCTANSDTALLNFSGVGPLGANTGYTKLPRALAVDNLPSRLEGNDTLLIVNRIGGSLITGAATIGTIFGIFYDDAENALSYSITAGTCQLRGSFSNSFPRVAPRFEQFIPAGRSGWTRFYSGIGAQTDNALLGAVINYNGSGGANAFNQGHNLHKLTLTAGNTPLTIPIFPPSC